MNQTLSVSLTKSTQSAIIWFCLQVLRQAGTPRVDCLAPMKNMRSVKDRTTNREPAIFSTLTRRSAIERLIRMNDYSEAKITWKPLECTELP